MYFQTPITMWRASLHIKMAVFVSGKLNFCQFHCIMLLWKCLFIVHYQNAFHHALYSKYNSIELYLYKTLSWVQNGIFFRNLLDKSKFWVSKRHPLTPKFHPSSYNSNMHPPTTLFPQPIFPHLGFGYCFLSFYFNYLCKNIYFNIYLWLMIDFLLIVEVYYK